MADATPEPHWGRDPTGRHIQRYWDGGAWTDFVATAAGGAPTTDPMDDRLRWPAPAAAAPTVPPQWARDPTGRHVQRYWDGTGWTGFVAAAAGAGRGPIHSRPVRNGRLLVRPEHRRRRPRRSRSRSTSRRSESRGRIPAFGWVALGLAILTGVVFALLTLGQVGRLECRVHWARIRFTGQLDQSGGGARFDEAGDLVDDEAGSARYDEADGAGYDEAGAAPGSSGSAVAPHSVDSAKDQALADRIGLTLADFPAGWQASAVPSHGLDLSVPECTGFHDRLAGTNAVAQTKSADFAKAGQRVSSSVDVLAVQPEAGAVVDMLADPALHRCLGSAFEAASRPSITSSAPADRRAERNGRRALRPASGGPERRTAGRHPSDVAGGHGRPLRRCRGVPRRPDGCPHRLRIAPDPVRRISRRAAPHTGHAASSIRRQHAVAGASSRLPPISRCPEWDSNPHALAGNRF